MTIPRNPSEVFYSDLDKEDQEYWASKVVAQPNAAHRTKLTRVTYDHLPTGYIICENDRKGAVVVQKLMVKNLREAGVTVREYTLSASHSPYLSQPEKVVDVISDFIGHVS